MTLQRLRSGATILRSPVDTWLGIRMFAWSLALPLLKHVVPLPLLVRLMWGPARRSNRVERQRQVVRLARGIYRFRPLRSRDNCLERSLLAYRFLSIENADPQLVVGARKSDSEVVGHAWVLVDGKPLYDPPATVDQFVTLAEFGRRGRRREQQVAVSASAGGHHHLV